MDPLIALTVAVTAAGAAAVLAVDAVDRYRDSDPLVLPSTIGATFCATLAASALYVGLGAL